MGLMLIALVRSLAKTIRPRLPTQRGGRAMRARQGWGPRKQFDKCPRWPASFELDRGAPHLCHGRAQGTPDDQLTTNM